MSDAAEAPLSRQLRRQQEELARWRKLEGTGISRTRPESAPKRRPVTVATPRREVAELQALVMERRELMARQRSARGEASARSLQLVRDARSRDPSPQPKPYSATATARRLSLIHI